MPEAFANPAGLNSLLIQHKEDADAPTRRASGPALLLSHFFEQDTLWKLGFFGPVDDVKSPSLAQSCLSRTFMAKCRVAAPEEKQAGGAMSATAGMNGSGVCSYFLNMVAYQVRAGGDG